MRIFKEKLKEEVEVQIVDRKTDPKSWTITPKTNPKKWTITIFISWYSLAIIVIYMLIGMYFGIYYCLNPRKI